MNNGRNKREKKAEQTEGELLAPMHNKRGGDEHEKYAETHRRRCKMRQKIYRLRRRFRFCGIVFSFD
jgi:hypothetical protein